MCVAIIRQTCEKK